MVGVMKRILAILALACAMFPLAVHAQESLPPLTISSPPRAQPIAVQRLRT
jgi:hypothetical protein